VRVIGGSFLDGGGGRVQAAGGLVQRGPGIHGGPHPGVQVAGRGEAGGQGQVAGVPGQGGDQAVEFGDDAAPGPVGQLAAAAGGGGDVCAGGAQEFTEDLWGSRTRPPVLTWASTLPARIR
jgi:hypothetical protein